MTEEYRGYYTFQCPACYIVSGFMSTDRSAAPTCCRGEKMVPVWHGPLTADLLSRVTKKAGTWSEEEE